MAIAAVPPFVSADWLAAATPPPVLLDLRWALDGSLGHHDYVARHLPGAVYLDLDTVAAGAPTPAGGRHPLPDAQAFASALGELGVGDADVVVAYDQGPGVIASRIVWMLRAIGQPAAVLDGGLAGWTGPVEAGPVTRTAVTRTVREWPVDRLADGDLTATIAGRDDGVVLDAREPARFAGRTEPVDPRAGHIPGAVNVPVTDNLDGSGRLRDRAALSERYAAAGALAADEVVAYCGSGVAACHDLLVLEQLGIRGRLFPGSWSAWSADPRREASRGTVDTQ